MPIPHTLRYVDMRRWLMLWMHATDVVIILKPALPFGVLNHQPIPSPERDRLAVGIALNKIGSPRPHDATLEIQFVGVVVHLGVTS